MKLKSTKYKSLQPIELSTEDKIEVLGVTDDEIILKVNGKRITLAEYESQIEFNI